MTGYNTPPPPPGMTGGTPSAPGKTFQIMKPARLKRGQRIVVFGGGGVGKSGLSSMAPNPCFMDIQMGASELEVARVSGLESVKDVRQALRDRALWKDYDSVVIDEATQLQEWAKEDVIANIKPEKGAADPGSEGTLEQYGWGKGYRYVYDRFVPVLKDIDSLVMQGKHAILVCHETTDEVVNTSGDDFKQTQFNLFNSPKSNIRKYVQGWADYIFYVQFDRVVDKDGKAKGSGSRTIWTQEQAGFWAKSRARNPPMPLTIKYENPTDDTLWKTLFKETH